MRKINQHDQSITRHDLEVFGKQLSEQLSRSIIGEITGVLHDFSDRVDERFDRLEGRVEKLEFQMVKANQQLASLEVRVSKLEESHERLANILDSFLKHIEDMRIENAARDHQIARLQRLIEQIAKETGVKLRYE